MWKSKNNLSVHSRLPFFRNKKYQMRKLRVLCAILALLRLLIFNFLLPTLLLYFFQFEIVYTICNAAVIELIMVIEWIFTQCVMYALCAIILLFLLWCKLNLSLSLLILLFFLTANAMSFKAFSSFLRLLIYPPLNLLTRSIFLWALI